MENSRQTEICVQCWLYIGAEAYDKIEKMDCQRYEGQNKMECPYYIKLEEDIRLLRNGEHPITFEGLEQIIFTKTHMPTFGLTGITFPEKKDPEKI